MKVLLLNTYDMVGGGAARAVFRFHQGLRRLGVDSQMLVQEKTSNEISIIGPESRLRKGVNKRRRFLDSLPLKLYPLRKEIIFSSAYLPEDINRQVRNINPDILHLNWIADGFVRIETLGKFKKPIVWTLHDSWAFTGGCHIPFECNRYVDNCGACPTLGSNFKKDLSYQILKRKKNSWKDLKLTLVTPSHWLRTCVQKSSLFRDMSVKTIPNGLDLNCYKPIEKKLARELLLLPQNKKLILFGANNPSDKNKGFHLLLEALKSLEEKGRGEDYELLIFGGEDPDGRRDLKMKSQYLGILHDDNSLKLLYSAADVFVSTSIQENLSNMIMEALACGTPCVAYNIGGMPDMIEHQLNGYLVKPYEIDQFAEGIDWVISEPDRMKMLSRRAREKAVEEFEIEHIVNQYLELYEEILS
ncbi:MAG: glycosyltransferase family 4 protein [Nitrospinae bacterium]|nr:glycosyltransferase family 4 protein [Nitrospinota bacterium]